MMEFKTITVGCDDRWDEMVRRCVDGTIYHLSVWASVLKATIGGQILSIIAQERSGRLIGGMPFMMETSLLRKRHMVPLPLTASCTPLLPPDQLAGALRHVMREEPRVHSVKLKFLDGTPFVAPGMEVTSDALCHHLDLSGSLDSVFHALGDSSVRHRISRADRNGARVRWTEDHAGVRELFRLITETRYRKGLPAMPYRFFANMWTLLRPLGLIDIPLLEMQGRIVAAAAVLKFGGRAHLEYSSCAPDFFRSGANQRLIWEAIRNAHEAGARLFDFGRSSVSNASLIAFKDQWGTKRVPILELAGPGSSPPATRLMSTARPLIETINRRMPRLLLSMAGHLLYRKQRQPNW
jgi:serine/alanine adding enzyme